MRIRKVPPYIIARAMIEAHKAGLKQLTRDELEAHYLAGGHVERVVHALVSASSSPGNYAPSSGKAPEARPLFRSQPIGHQLLLLRDSPAFHNRKDHRGPHPANP